LSAVRYTVIKRLDEVHRHRRASLRCFFRNMALNVHEKKRIKNT